MTQHWFRSRPATGNCRIYERVLLYYDHKTGKSDVCIDVGRYVIHDRQAQVFECYIVGNENPWRKVVSLAEALEWLQEKV